MNDSRNQRCAFCGGGVARGKCVACGRYVDDGLAATAKRPSMSAGSTRRPAPQDDLTRPRMPATSFSDLTLPRTAAIPQSASSETGETKALIEKSIKGTQWIMVAILIGVPLGLLTNIVMGRISTVAFGIYSLMLVLVQMIQTFFLFGGSNVIVNFIPRVSAREKSALLASYVGLALGFSVVFFALMLAYPQALHFLLLNQYPISSSIYAFLLIFFPIVIAQTLTIAVLQGEMELAAAARTQYGVQTASFALALVTALVVIPRHILPMQVAVPLVVLLAYLLSFASGFLALQRVMRRRWRLSFRWYLPPRFWKFTLTVHFHTIVTFFLNNVDQLYILYSFSTFSALGVYRAAIVVATYALWAPNLFTGAMYPFFTNLVAKGDFKTLKGAFQRYSAITAVVVAFVSLAAGLFAPQILHLFGKQYGQQSLPLMVIFSLMYVVFASAAYVPSGALITAHEDVWINMTLNFVALCLRLGLYVALVPSQGLLGVAIANAISLGVLYLSTLVAVGLRYHVSVPLRQHVVSLAGGILLVLPYLWEPSSHALQIAERAGALLLFVAIITQLRLVSKEDLQKIASRFGNNKYLRKLFPKTA